MDTLIALGTGTAWLYSMVVVFAPDIVPLMARHVYFEATAMIIGLINLGLALEIKARGKTSEAIKLPANVGGISFGIKRSGTVKYKVQLSYSTETQERDGEAEWFDWEDLPGLDINGYMDLDSFQWWIPIPSFMRIVIDAGTLGDTVSLGMRAQ